MEEYRNSKRDYSEDSNNSYSQKDLESSNNNFKKPKNENFEELKTARTEILQKHFGYTDENNPFGDEELTHPFVWEKNEKFQTSNKNSLDKSSVKVVESKVEELKQVKKRREQYELEKTRLVESRLQSSRKQDDEAYEDWEAKGVEFNLKQIVSKPLMRFKQGRPKLVDKLVLAVDPDFNETFSETFDVNNMFKTQSKEDVEEAQEILNAYLDLNKIPKQNKYLESLLVLSKEPSENNYEMSGVSQMVGNKIDQILSTKSIDELKVFEDQIHKKLNGGGVVDTNFWETALSRIPYFKACKYVSSVLSGFDTDGRNLDDNKYMNENRYEKREKENKNNKDNNNMNREDKHDRENEDDNEDKETKENKEQNKDKEKQNKEEKENKKKKGRADYEKFVQYTKLEEDEEMFDDVVEVEEGGLETPMYYNRIKKGFEWNKYNLAHYDQEHLPPKQVQGYRFNVFYPELKGKVPKWKLQKDGNSSETALIRFIGGHPYKDIAFRIVNKEWITDPQKGFKNFFDNGVLHLYFDFKKIKYRR